MFKNSLRPLVLLVLVGLVSACAGPNTLTDIPAPDTSIAGFWWGLVHGVILPFSFIGSLFSENISIYEVHNTGGWYDFGFVLGVIGLTSTT